MRGYVVYHRGRRLSLIPEPVSKVMNFLCKVEVFSPELARCAGIKSVLAVCENVNGWDRSVIVMEKPSQSFMHCSRLSIENKFRGYSPPPLAKI